MKKKRGKKGTGNSLETYSYRLECKKIWGLSKEEEMRGKRRKKGEIVTIQIIKRGKGGNKGMRSWSKNQQRYEVEIRKW